MGYIVIQGGGEFNGLMRKSDLRALELAGGLDASVRIIPAAAAPDNNHERAARKGIQWFRSLGASNVSVVDLIDRSSAQDAQVANKLSEADLIYLIGGFAGYLAGILSKSVCSSAIAQALNKNAVIAGSSAGAMVLAQHLYNPETARVIEGLGLLSKVCILPHHAGFGWKWAALLKKDLPQAILFGIDEQTGAINDAGQYGWTVYGRGAATLYREDGIFKYTEGMTFNLPEVFRQQ